MRIAKKRIKGAPQGWFVLFWSGIEYIGGTSFPWSGRVMWDLEAQPWFLPYCKKWLWYADEDADGNREIYDKLERLRQRGQLK